MTNLIPISHRWKFLAQWLGLNLLGCVIGICFLIGLGIILVFQNVPINIYIFLFFLGAFMVIFGTSVGIFQWLMLRKFGISLFLWAFMTAFGYCIGTEIAFFLLSLSSFIFSYSHIPIMSSPLVGIIIGAVGVAIIGAPQSIIIRKHISGSALWWVRAHVFGLFLPLIVNFLDLDYRTVEFRSHIKKAFLVTVLSNDEALFWNIYSLFYDARWLLWVSLALLSLGIAILTGIVLFIQPKPGSALPYNGANNDSLR